MNNTYLKKRFKPFLWIAVLLIVAYGLGRLYYKTTGGFTIGNITYELPHDARWEISPLSVEKSKQLDAILSQNFYYLGKGCQSYVFKSEDDKYVIKFMKYQRFRPRPWLEYLTFIPAIDRHLEHKLQSKKEKLDSVFTSWKIAYDSLQEESGVVYVHLNKSSNLNKTLVIFDKMGFERHLDLDKYEFLVQRKAQMLCTTINAWMANGDLEESKRLISQLLKRIISENDRSLADNDHALMQNTGVLDQQPVHIDVGQFVRNKQVLIKSVRNQELFNKTWKFRKWLEKHHPELADHLVILLKNYIGESEFALLTPRLNKAEMGILSHHQSD